MNAIAVLLDEHRLIERVLDALEIASSRLSRNEPVRPEFFLEAVEFFAGYADGCHHHKEEEVLFGAMGGPDGPEAGGAVAMLLDEHQEGRRLIHDLRDGAKRLAAGDDSARRDITTSARRYITLLEDHIEKEDEMLFPLAEELLSSTEQDEVGRKVDRIVADERAAGSQDRYVALAEALIGEVGAPRR
jgi:hemerythrin-like domain-containing protein